MRNADIRRVPPISDTSCGVILVVSTVVLIALGALAWRRAVTHSNRQTLTRPIVRFIVPDGFRGIFTVRQDARNGTPPIVAGNTTEYRIPRNGCLVSADMRALRSWHRLQGEYVSGEDLPVLGYAKNSGSNVLLRILASGADDNIFMLVGTDEEEREYRRTREVWLRIDSVESQEPSKDEVRRRPALQ
jgi:hypothetical protein